MSDVAHVQTIDKPEKLLRLTLFRTFDARLSTHAPIFPTRKAQCLLALLALHLGREAERDWLAGVLWPESDPAKALFNLRQTLSSLRRTLGEAAICIRSSGRDALMLEESLTETDVSRFDAALTDRTPAGWEMAVNLYGGPLLTDWFEDWVLPERETRVQAYLGALENLGKHALTHGETVVAIRWLRLLSASDPYRESTASLLMQALSDSGDRAAMQQVYQQLRYRLREDLGASLSPETETLYQRLTHRETQAIIPVTPSVTVGHSLRHLPVPLTDLIGREAEVEEVTGWLKRSRLVTLLGPGGVGKTRLSVAAAEAALPQFSDGVWFVDLAPLQDASRVPETVARTLGVPDDPTKSLEERLTQFLFPRTQLLILDNCEHLQDACSSLAFGLLSVCPDLRILATSRHSLGITGEQVYPLPSLEVPPRDVKRISEKDASTLMEFSSVRLFMQRALQVKPTFQLDRGNAPIVASICRRLDGIPLALEMAAARLRSLSIAEVDARLSNRFRLLTTGSRTALPRQQTLRATLDWSYDLLSPAERRLLNRLSVFVGGFTRAGALALCPLEYGEDCDDLLDSLTDKSLLVGELNADPPRYRMLETVREYGLEKLALISEIQEIRRLHRDYFLALTEAANAKWEREHDRCALAQLDDEYENIREALRYAIRTADSEKSWRLLRSLHAYWNNHGTLSEGRRIWQLFLLTPAAQARTRERADALRQCARMAAVQNDYVVAETCIREAADLYRELGDIPRYVDALLAIGCTLIENGQDEEGKVYLKQCISLAEQADRGTALWSSIALADMDGQYDLSVRYAEEYLQYMREKGDRERIAHAMHTLSYRVFRLGDYTYARKISEEGLQINRQTACRYGELLTLQHLGAIAIVQGDNAAGSAYMRGSLRLQKETERKQELILAIQGLGDVAMLEEQWNRAVCLFAISEAMLESHRLFIEWRSVTTEEQVARLRERLDPGTFERLWQQGRSFTTEEAIDFALGQEKESCSE